MSLEQKGGTWRRRLLGLVIPTRASLPTTEDGEQLFTGEEPGAVEIIQAGAVLRDENALPSEIIHGGAAVAEENALPIQMHRRYVTGGGVIGAGEVQSTVIDMRPYVSGVVYIPHEWSAADIGFAVGYDPGIGPWSPAYDDNGNLIQITVNWVDRAYSFPPEIFAHGWIRFWSQRGASNRPQGELRVLHYELKS